MHFINFVSNELRCRLKRKILSIVAVRRSLFVAYLVEKFLNAEKLTLKSRACLIQTITNDLHIYVGKMNVNTDKTKKSNMSGCTS